MQSRKWQLTINNPSEKGITHDVLKESLAKFTGMLYWCMCDETGSEGTYHTHVYFVLRTPHGPYRTGEPFSQYPP